MLIWIDTLTPKQLHFLGELGKKLETKGHNVFRTTRHYKELNELIKLRNIASVRFLSVGKHGGASLEGKLAASMKRTEKLAHIISRLKPDISIAFASPEAARTAFGLQIPHYTINDSPHANAVARLTIPISSKLFSPAIIPKKVWTNLGARRDKIIQYNALDPIVWLKTFTPDSMVLDELNLDRTKPIVIIRVEETFASYLLKHVPDRRSVTIPIIKRLVNYFDHAVQIVVLPRYLEQISSIRTAFQNEVIVPKGVVDGPSLLFFSSLFIGAGGTMTAEAAMLGTPTISCYPGEPTLVEKFLKRRKLVVRAKDPEKAVKRAIKSINNYDRIHKLQQERARSLIAEMEDPLEIIIKVLENDFMKK